MRFVWFWTFWHWSRESFRAGALLRSPLHGISGHWDEWFRHEASESDRRAIEQVGSTKTSQRDFIAWLLRRWAREADLSGNRAARRFVLGQLANVQPFSQWTVFEKFRAGYGLLGMSAVVLAEKSHGDAGDVRSVEALALPSDPTSSTVVPEGFQAGAVELETPRQAARSLLAGKGLLIFLALWIAGGRRPYAGWLKVVLAAGWAAVGGLIVYLLVGPDPGKWLFRLSVTLAALWSGLVFVAVTTALTQSWRAWRLGRNWAGRLEKSQIRLRMNGGLTVKGGSAGLPFCLNTLFALHSADPGLARGSWLWRCLFRRFQTEAGAWAATAVVTADGYLEQVVLEPKLRACLQQEGIRHILTPRQAGADNRVISRLADTLRLPRRESIPVTASIGGLQLGFAAEKKYLHAHPCRHAAQALMRLGGFTSPPQKALNAFALAASIAMLFGLHDLRGILLPPSAPSAVAPSSPSPYYLWVSLNTKHPEYFQVVLESHYWSNRRAQLAAYGGDNLPVRAEMRLQRLSSPINFDVEDGVVWLERRRRFLTREFAGGERVGRYTISYLNRLGYE